jgi:integrase
MASKTAGRGRQKGSGTIYKEKNRFYFQTKSEGKRRTYLLRNEDDSPCTTRLQAEEAAARLNKTTLELDTQEKVILKVAEVRQLKKEATFGFNDIWPTFMKNPNRPDASESHLRGQRRELDKFIAWAREHGMCSPSEITAKDAGEYMNGVGESISNRCFNVYLGFLRLIFSLTFKDAGLNANPFDGIKRRKEITASRSDFTQEQVAAIFAGFRDGFIEEVKQEGFDGHGGRSVKMIRHEYTPLHKDEMEVLLKLCCFTGCDGQSGCLMRWDGVDMAANTISYIRQKTKKATGGKVITLPIHSVLREALEKAMAWREAGCPYILPHVSERYQRNHWGVQKDVQKIIRCALGCDVTNREAEGKRAKAASLYSLHSFRHSFVSWSVAAGVNMDIVAEIVGHGNPIMTRHYLHVHDDAKQAAIAALPDIGADVSQPPKDITAEALRMQAREIIEAMDVEDLRAFVESRKR